jgi:hypothetical protein
MGKLEEKAQTQSWFPRIWHRYVDDVLAIVRKGNENIVLQELNQQHEAICFTLEVESLGSLSFLYLKLNRKGDIEVQHFAQTDRCSVMFSERFSSPLGPQGCSVWVCLI